MVSAVASRRRRWGSEQTVNPRLPEPFEPHKITGESRGRRGRHGERSWRRAILRRLVDTRCPPLRLFFNSLGRFSALNRFPFHRQTNTRVRARLRVIFREGRGRHAFGGGGRSRGDGGVTTSQRRRRLGRRHGACGRFLLVVVLSFGTRCWQCVRSCVCLAAPLLGSKVPQKRSQVNLHWL